MSWRLHYELQLRDPLTAKNVEHAELYGPELSAFASGFELTGVPGESRLHGSTQLSGDWRTVNDVLRVLATLLRAELDFEGRAFVTGLFAHDERLAVAKLDLEDVQRKLTALWGSVDLGLEAEEGEEDEERPTQRPETKAPSRKVEKWLASARADFELWKKSQGEG